MARSRSRAGAAPSRQTKATSRKRTGGTASGATVEVVEEKEGPGIETGIVVITFVILAAAFIFVDRGLGQLYGEGLFFK
jgi:hypothetical protein